MKNKKSDFYEYYYKQVFPDMEKFYTEDLERYNISKNVNFLIWKKCIIKKGDKIVKFNTYPSKRMFDTMSVWGDITSGLLADMTMIQWIIIALIFDVVSFILFTIFRNQ